MQVRLQRTHTEKKTLCVKRIETVKNNRHWLWSMRKVSINEFMFIEAFQRDEDFEEYDQRTHLDLETGEVIWIFDEDHDTEMWAGIYPEENANNTFIPEVTL